MNEQSYKLSLVKRLIKETPTCVALEVPFCAATRRADAVSILDNKLHAYEIKSAVDKLDKLRQQIDDYQKVFDFVWVLVAPKHLSSARKILPRSIGILVQEHGEATKKRDAKQRKRLSKTELIYSIDKKRLEHAIKPKTSTKNYSDVHHECCALISTSQARIIFVDQILEKYGAGYSVFLKESGSIIHEEDLLNLGLVGSIS